MAESTGDGARTCKFFCYRYALVASNQMRIWDNANGKRRIIDEIVEHCAHVEPYRSSSHGAENVLVYIRPIGKTAHLFKFCRQRSVRKYEIEGDGSDVSPHVEESYPYVYLLADTEVQVVLIEKRSGLFDNPGSAKAAFVALVKDFMSDENYYFSLDEISANASFWDTVETADEVYDVTLHLKSPNFLGAGYTTTELLKRIKDVSNNDSVTFKLKSENGTLEVPRQEYEDAVEYATAGGGSWTVTVAKDGHMRVKHHSDQYVQEIELIISDDAQVDEESLSAEIREVGARKEPKNDAL